MRKYGVNVVSLWPWSVGLFGLSNSIDIALRAGYKGIQALPMRRWNYENAKVWEQYILSYENAWNYGPFWQVVARWLRLTKNPAAPALRDYVLFDRKNFPYLQNVLCVEHHTLGANDRLSFALEMNPEYSPYVKDYRQYCMLGGLLCWDTLHVRRPRSFDGRLLDWKELLLTLPPTSVRIIHVHPTVAEIPELLAHKDSELAEMLGALASWAPKNTPVILEVFPPLQNWFSYSRTKEFVGKLLKVIKYHFKD